MAGEKMMRRVFEKKDSRMRSIELVITVQGSLDELSQLL